MVTLDMAKEYLRLDDVENDTLLNMCINSSYNFIKNYTGLTDDEIESNTDLQYAQLALIADMYELRQATVNGVQQNPFVEMVLNMYQRGLLV